MSTLMKTYPMKLILSSNQEYLQYFKQLTEIATNQLLKKLWSEDWIRRLGTTTTKAHSIVNSKQVTLEFNEQFLYLPSRVRMGIAERVGRILRAQYKRMLCFYDCLKVVEIIGITSNDRKLTDIMKYTYQTKNGFPKYKQVMIKQTIFMLKNWHKRLGLDLQMMKYTDLVEPKIKKFVFLFAPDNYRILKYERQNQVINYSFSLPTKLESKNKNDWHKITGEIIIPDKIQQKLQLSLNHQPKKPKLTIRNLKGGKQHFFLNFPWEFLKRKKKRSKSIRALAIDLGLKKLATIVICENKKQISKPIYLRLIGKQYRHIERLYNHIAGIQKQIDRNYLNDNRLIERERLHYKIKRIREEIANSVANLLIKIALDWQCQKIIFEDLRHFKPRRNNKWSRKLSEWLRGRIPDLVEHRCDEKGLTLQKVNPWKTSSYCPRCNSTSSQRLLGPNNAKLTTKGRWFNCPDCGFTADRDYIAALNIYRASFIDYKKIKSLTQTNPIPYMDIGIPSPDCSWRRSRNELTSNQVVLITGG